MKKTLTTHIHTYRHSSHRYYKLCWLQAAVRQKKKIDYNVTYYVLELLLLLLLTTSSAVAVRPRDASCH